MLRITIEQDEYTGTAPQIQSFTTSDQAQAKDGGGAPSARSVFRHRAMKEAASVPHLGNVSVRDAGAAPRVLQHLRRATMPVIQGSKEMVKPSNGGAAPGAQP